MGINTDAVQRLYIAYFDRPADPAGLAYWESQLPSTTVATQAQLATIAAGFSGSAEYAKYVDVAHIAAIEGFVNNRYYYLFGHAADPAGLAHWAGKLADGSETFASIALQLTFSAQGADATAIANKVTAAKAFTTALDTPAETDRYSSIFATASARSWLATVTDSATLAAATTTTALDAAVSAAVSYLTQDPDNITGTPFNDIIRGTAGVTLTSADTVDGGAGTDTVILYDGKAIAATDFGGVSNIEVIELGIYRPFIPGIAYTADMPQITNNVAITTVDALVAAGATLTLNASRLSYSIIDASGVAVKQTGVLTFNGAAETNGRFVITGGGAADTITGGAGADTLSGDRGADTLTGGIGADTFVYTAFMYPTLTHSLNTVLDQLPDYTQGTDKIDVTTVPTSLTASAGVDLTTGSVASTGTTATTLANDIASFMGARAANSFDQAGDIVVLTVTGASIAGTGIKYILINDGTAAYSATADAVIALVGTSTAPTALADFV